MDDDLDFLQNWFLGHCDGDWEHDDRVAITTLDNPGWRLWVDLSGTELAGRRQSRAVIEVDSHDWLTYWSDGEIFDAPCGPGNLGDALRAFAAFAQGVSLDSTSSPNGSIWKRGRTNK